MRADRRHAGAVRRQPACRSSGSSRPAWPTLRSDAVELTDDPRAAEVAAGMLTFAELLAAARRGAPGPHRRRGGRAAALPPRAVLGWDADAARCSRRPAPTVTRVGRLLRPGRQLRHGARPLRRVGRGRRDPPAARRARRPGRRGARRRASPAGYSSTTSRASRRCTSPSCWPLDSTREPPPPPSRHPGRAGALLLIVVVAAVCP